MILYYREKRLLWGDKREKSRQEKAIHCFLDVRLEGSKKGTGALLLELYFHFERKHAIFTKPMTLLTAIIGFYTGIFGEKVKIHFYPTNSDLSEEKCNQKRWRVNFTLHFYTIYENNVMKGYSPFYSDTNQIQKGYFWGESVSQRVFVHKLGYNSPWGRVPIKLDLKNSESDWVTRPDSSLLDRLFLITHAFPTKRRAFQQPTCLSVNVKNEEKIYL